jgi:hypothetical protein
MATANRGQITQFHRPANTRNPAHRRESFIPVTLQAAAPPPGARLTRLAGRRRSPLTPPVAADRTQAQPIAVG